MEERIIDLQEQVKSLRQYIQELENKLIDHYASKAYVQVYIQQLLGDHIAVADKLTGTSLIQGYTPLDVEHLINKIPNGYYTKNDWRGILRTYDHYSRIADINPYILVAQMFKETDWGRSWWARRPRRNPAGIGVTGETSKEKPKDTSAWAEREDGGMWLKGYSFPSWEVGIQAHIGHMLAYMYKDQELTDEYKQFIALDPRAKFIPNNWRGSIIILNDLDGKWASPGVGYGQSIATLVNAIKK